jgi:predicted NBD/HSP70 family sugar kinase
MLEDSVGAEAVVAAAVALGMPRPAGPKEVFAAARAGDQLALAAVRTEAERLAYAVAAVAAVLDPALVVLGGGIGDNADLLLDPLREALEELTPLHPDLAASKLGGDAVLMGAIATATAIAREHVFEVRSSG